MKDSGIKVLFISSGRNGRVGDVVLNQGESLKKSGIDIEYFLIRSGLRGYLSAILSIRRVWKSGNYDLAHAHYGLSAFAASVAGRFPLIVSLMGSDVFMSGISRIITRILYRYRWSFTIVKTRQMKELLGLSKAEVIPNGVDICRFKPIPMQEARDHIGFPLDRRLIIFISSPHRPEKNADLAAKAMSELNIPDVELKYIYNISNEDIPYYLNAADILLLTSKREGSANVIKEAMACNCPIVSTDVGDIRWLTENTSGSFITSFDAKDVANSLKKGLRFGARTNGRERIMELSLDAGSVAVNIKSLYEKALS